MTLPFPPILFTYPLQKTLWARTEQLIYVMAKWFRNNVLGRIDKFRFLQPQMDYLQRKRSIQSVVLFDWDRKESPPLLVIQWCNHDIAFSLIIQINLTLISVPTVTELDDTRTQASAFFQSSRLSRLARAEITTPLTQKGL